MPNSSQAPALGNKSCGASQAQPSHSPGHQPQRGCQDGLPQSGNNSHWHTGTGMNPTASLPDPCFRVGSRTPVSDGGPSVYALAGTACFCLSKWQRDWVLYTVTTDDTRNCPAAFRPPPQTHSSHHKWFQPSYPTNQLYGSGRKRQSTDRKNTVVRTPKICDLIPDLLCDKPQSLGWSMRKIPPAGSASVPEL